MNANRFTQKSLEAIQGAQTLAASNRNTEVAQVHLLKALIDESDDLNTQLLASMQVDVPALRAAVDRAIGALLTYSGDSQQSYASPAISRAIAEADAQA
jgi:ATP-dependent Clp protease ATP-binding subunit ClpB